MNLSVASSTRMLKIAVAGLLAGACVLALIAQRSYASANRLADRDSARDAVVEVAREAAVAFTSYDYRSLTQSFAKLRAVATKDFAIQFAQASSQLKPLILKKKASSTGRVMAASLLEDPESNGASVLVAADATVRNTDVPQGAVQRFRLRIVLQRLEGSWRVKEISPVV